MEVIKGFSSESEFRRFQLWLEEKLEKNICTDISLNKRSKIDQYRYYLFVENGEIWQLTPPDPGYFAGSWDLIAKIDN